MWSESRKAVYVRAGALLRHPSNESRARHRGGGGAGNGDVRAEKSPKKNAAAEAAAEAVTLLFPPGTAAQVATAAAGATSGEAAVSRFVPRVCVLNDGPPPVEAPASQPSAGAGRRVVLVQLPNDLRSAEGPAAPLPLLEKLAAAAAAADGPGTPAPFRFRLYPLAAATRGTS